MRNDNITKLTLAGMFAALAFVCFTYLRIDTLYRKIKEYNLE